MSSPYTSSTVQRIHPFQDSRRPTRREFQGNCSSQLALSSDEFAVATRKGRPAAFYNLARVDVADFAKCSRDARDLVVRMAQRFRHRLYVLAIRFHSTSQGVSLG